MSPAAPALEGRAETAAYLARLGGRMALDHLRDPLVSWKPDDSMVTDVDLAIQQRLEKEIRQTYPADVVIGEEGGHAVLDPSLAGRPVWIIDPIDGTNNFGRGLPGFSVSVGVMRGGWPVAGAVYDPLAEMLFTACRGRGAALNGEPIATRPAALTRRSLSPSTHRSTTACPGPCSAGSRATGCAASAPRRFTCATWRSAAWRSSTTIARPSGTSPAGRPCCWKRVVS